jgi:NTP pyrophosphatase (non-canonical NTP hydrolase)
MDHQTTIKECKDLVEIFCEERDWSQFHNPKDLAIGISTEANELLDLFRFKSGEQMEEMMKNPDKRKKIEEELADTFFFILRFAQMNDLDLAEALKNKLKANGEKYPVDRARGSNLKYDEETGG